MIAADGDNVAVRGADGRLHLLSSRRGRFDAEIWLRRDGDQREVADIQPDEPYGFTCDAAGCITHIRGLPGRSLVVAWSGEALADDCRTATIVVDLTRGWRRPCTAAQLAVTRQTLNVEGAIAARLAGDTVSWTSVARERGDRPWTPKRRLSSAGQARPNGPAP